MNYKKLTIGIMFVAIAGSFYFVFQGNTVQKFISTTDIKGLPDAKASEAVELKNGDTFELAASVVKKKIGDSEVRMLAYNGMVPGPTIKVKKGSEITIHFVNNTGIPTTLHSHGVRLENIYDGAPNATQKEIAPGAAFTYKIKFPDEGVYWYHPHVREDYAQEMGLYGNFIVEPTDEKYWSPVNREVPLAVDDILIQNGKIASFGVVSTHTLMGRYGNVMLVNGDSNYSLNVKQGEVVRFYITNTSNTRVFNLSIPHVKLKLVGGDNGKYEKETFVTNVILGPSERVVVEALFDKSGAYNLVHTTPSKIYSMGSFNVSSEKVSPDYHTQFGILRVNQDIIKSIDPFRSSFEKKADKNISFLISMGGAGMHQMPDGSMMNNGGHMMPDGTMMSDSYVQGSTTGEKIEWEDTMWMMNNMSDASTMKWGILDQDTGKQNHAIDWKFNVGDKVKIKIYNDPNTMHPMQHPFHMHGQRFLVLSTNGAKNTNLVWKDTVLVEKGDTVEILVDMQNPGEWMAHCHIAEHLESGMMFNFEVK